MDPVEAASLVTVVQLPSEVHQVADGQFSSGVLKAGVDFVLIEL